MLVCARKPNVCVCVCVRVCVNVLWDGVCVFVVSMLKNLLLWVSSFACLTQRDYVYECVWIDVCLCVYECV